MRAWIAFWKKEWMELTRSGRLVLLLLLSLLFGVMNPAIAKLTPWLMETMADSLQETGLQVTRINVDAMTSWMQFYKNMPLALLAAVLLLAGTFTKEYQSNTLLLALTKGLSRHKVYTVKMALLLCLWTVYFWLSFGITWLYNAFYWDNGAACHLVSAAACFWLFGMLVFMLAICFSSVFSETSAVLAGTGGVLLLTYAAGIFPRARMFLPIKLMEVQALLTNDAVLKDYWRAACAALLLALGAGAAGLCLFEKKKI